MFDSRLNLNCNHIKTWFKFLDLNLNESLIEKTKVKRKTSFHSDFKPSFSLNLKFHLARQAPPFSWSFFITYLLTAFIYLLHLFICLFVFFDIPVAFTLWELLKFQKLFATLNNLWFQQKTYYKKPHNYTWNYSLEKLTEGISVLQRQCYHTLYYHEAINEL